MDELHINDILPVYFQENRKNSSEIWGKDLVFQRGEMVKIVAPSGKGKTSLVHFLYGLRKDYNGKISYGKKNISGFGVDSFAKYRREHISVVFQDMRLFPSLHLKLGGTVSINSSSSASMKISDEKGIISPALAITLKRLGVRAAAFSINGWAFNSLMSLMSKRLSCPIFSLVTVLVIEIKS